MIGLMFILGCGNESNDIPTQPTISTPTNIPAPVANSNYRPLPINYNWKDTKCVSPINNGADTYQIWAPLMKCTMEAQGMETNFGGFGAPILDYGYQVNTDTLLPIRAGYTSERFHIENGWCWKEYDCTRTPMYERMEKSEKWDANKEGDDNWYGWSFFVSVDETIPFTWMGQFQQYPSSAPI